MIPDNYQGGIEYTDTTDDATDLAFLNAEQRFFTASDDPRVVELRKQVQALAAVIDLTVPPGRNKSIALTSLEDVQMRANRAIFAPVPFA